MDKGSFRGDTIQETQPIYEDINYPWLLKQIRIGVAIIGHCLVIAAAFLLFSINQGGIETLSLNSLFSGIFYPGVFLASGIALLTFAHLYWGEMPFKSYLVQFQGEGTYTESKLSVGMAITDSTRSENTVVRTSFSTRFLVTEIITSTQARSGRNTLDGPRYILSMYKSDELLNHLVNQVNNFLEDRQLIAASTSEQDGNAIKSLYATNEAAPGLGNFKNPDQRELAGSYRQQEEGDY